MEVTGPRDAESDHQTAPYKMTEDLWQMHYRSAIFKSVVFCEFIQKS
jgi:hypothetical protein